MLRRLFRSVRVVCTFARAGLCSCYEGVKCCCRIWLEILGHSERLLERESTALAKECFALIVSLLPADESFRVTRTVAVLDVMFEQVERSILGVEQATITQQRRVVGKQLW